MRSQTPKRKVRQITGSERTSSLEREPSLFDPTETKLPRGTALGVGFTRGALVACHVASLWLDSVSYQRREPARGLFPPS